MSSPEQEEQFLELAETVMSLPTAPFCEHLVSGFVKEFAAQLPTVSVAEDPFGNLLLMHEGTGARSGRPRSFVIATAHMDHPGLVCEQRLSARDFLFRKQGGIPLQHTKHAALAIYDPHAAASQAPIRGRITALLDSATVTGRQAAVRGGDPAFSVRVDVDDGGSLRAGSFAMWDLVPFEQRDRQIRGRACDDLAGVACGLSYLRALVHADAPVRAGLLLTRAEEIGFGGMAAAVTEGSLDKRGVYVNIECSNAEAASALPGAGPIVRVGDRLSTFDPEVTRVLSFLGDDLGDGFRYQRKLMDGGACEASVLMQAGLRTGALALPLANYHNNGKKGLRPEIIHLDDALGLVELLVALATARGGVNKQLTAAARRLRTALGRRQEHNAARLRETQSARLAPPPTQAEPSEE